MRQPGNPSDFLRTLYTLLAPRGCNAESLARLLSSWYSWRDVHPLILAVQALEADPLLALSLCRLLAYYEALFALAGRGQPL